MPERELVTNYLEDKKITEEILNEHFTTLMTSFIESISTKDYEALEKVTEKRFYNKLMEQKDTLEKFELKYDVTNENAENESYIIDKLFVKGVNHDRDLNDSNLDYNYVNLQEN